MEGSTPDEHVSVAQILYSFALLMSCHGKVRLSCRLGGEQTEGVTPEAQKNRPSRVASAVQRVVEMQVQTVVPCFIADGDWYPIQDGTILCSFVFSLGTVPGGLCRASSGGHESHRRWTVRILVKLVFRHRPRLHENEDGGAGNEAVCCVGPSHTSLAIARRSANWVHNFKVQDTAAWHDRGVEEAGNILRTENLMYHKMLHRLRFLDSLHSVYVLLVSELGNGHCPKVGKHDGKWTSGRWGFGGAQS